MSLFENLEKRYGVEIRRAIWMESMDQGDYSSVTVLGEL